MYYGPGYTESNRFPTGEVANQAGGFHLIRLSGAPVPRRRRITGCPSNCCATAWVPDPGACGRTDP